MNYKKFLLSCLLAACLTPSKADEGMWMLTDLKEQNAAVMREMGLEIPVDAIYSPDSISLKDAVVHFGGGCTGEVISKEGLVLTNHHCGYSYIQQHSSVEHDYLTDGFWAMNRQEELPCKGLSVTFIDRILDVTDFVQEQLAKDPDPQGINYLSPSYLKTVADRFALVEGLPRDGFPDSYGERRTLLLEGFFGQVHHFQIDFQADFRAEVGQVVEEVGVLSYEVDGHDVPLVLDCFRDKAFLPFEVLDYSIFLPADHSSGERDDLRVGGVCGIHFCGGLFG